MSEFQLIRDHFFWKKAPDSVHVGIGDDAAVLALPAGHEMVVSVDTLNEGVHFPVKTAPHAIGWKSLAVNLSDLAAMGASPAWFTLAISIPHADGRWVSEFARGLRELAEKSGIFLAGGDTTRGPLSITIQVMGFVKPGQALLRSNAADGDLICVTGTLGDAAAGLNVLQQQCILSDAAAEFCIERLNYPTPRLLMGTILSGRATACMDISDGLLADLGHMLTASGVGAHLQHAALPLSAALGELPANQQRDFALSGGDDYELLFTLPKNRLAEVQKLAKQSNIPVTVIGRIDRNQSGVSLDCPIVGGRRGYEHFSSN